MIDWGQIFASIIQMLGMCFGGVLIGGVIFFFYKKFTKKEDDSLLIVFFPGLAGLSFGLLLLSIELSDMGLPEFVYWFLAVPAYVGMAWAVPMCFMMFVLMPALGLLGLALSISATGLEKSLGVFDKRKHKLERLLKISVLPIIIIKRGVSALLEFFKPNKSGEAERQNSSGSLSSNENNKSKRSWTGYIWVVVILAVVLLFKLLGSVTGDLKKSLKSIKEQAEISKEN